MLSLEQPLVDQLGDGPAHGHAADTQVLAEIPFGLDLGIGSQFP